MSDDSSITKGGNELEVRKRDGWSCFRRRQVRPGAFCEGLVEENGFPCCTCQQQFFVMLFYTWFFQTLTCTLPRLLFSNLAVACWLKKKHAACISPTWPATVQWWQFWVGKISRFNISVRRCRQLHCPAIIVARKLGGLN